MRIAILATAALLAAPAMAQAPTRQVSALSAPLAAYACGGCHGVGSTGSGPVVALAGRPEQEIVSAMKAFRANERPGTIMGRIARGYTDEEIAAIAAALSSWR
ncbi:c-type cytochrome [Elioraea rosea]|uniref:c-type cytochrome n=1 Tax=Elioraea rosea TaxID=2492390 RepID=UPI00118446D6|nr:c-type cytochrome [Elioraea rosea]